jgi:protein phosphatase
VDPEIHEVDVKKGEKVLICSDGVTDGIWNSELKELLEKESTAKEIVDYAVKISGRDNATAVVIRLT